MADVKKAAETFNEDLNNALNLSKAQISGLEGYLKTGTTTVRDAVGDRFPPDMLVIPDTFQEMVDRLVCYATSMDALCDVIETNIRSVGDGAEILDLVVQGPGMSSSSPLGMLALISKTLTYYDECDQLSIKTIQELEASLATEEGLHSDAM